LVEARPPAGIATEHRVVLSNAVTGVSGVGAGLEGVVVVTIRVAAPRVEFDRAHNSAGAIRDALALHKRILMDPRRGVRLLDRKQLATEIYIATLQCATVARASRPLCEDNKRPT
jgi:hypothetical protein